MTFEGYSLGLKAGQWHSPTTVSLVLRNLLEKSHGKDIRMYVAQDTCIYLDKIESLARGNRGAEPAQALFASSRSNKYAHNVKIVKENRTVKKIHNITIAYNSEILFPKTVKRQKKKKSFLVHPFYLEQKESEKLFDIQQAKYFKTIPKQLKKNLPRFKENIKSTVIGTTKNKEIIKPFPKIENLIPNFSYKIDMKKKINKNDESRENNDSTKLNNFQNNTKIIKNNNFGNNFEKVKRNENNNNQENVNTNKKENFIFGSSSELNLSTENNSESFESSDTSENSNNFENIPMNKDKPIPDNDEFDIIDIPKNVDLVDEIDDINEKGKGKENIKRNDKVNDNGKEKDKEMNRSKKKAPQKKAIEIEIENDDEEKNMRKKEKYKDNKKYIRLGIDLIKTNNRYDNERDRDSNDDEQNKIINLKSKSGIERGNSLIKAKIQINFQKDQEKNTNDDIWIPIIIFLPIRLGMKKINSIYIDPLIEILSFSQSLGIVGGKPNTSLYFIAAQDQNFYYLDPHKTQKNVDNYFYDVFDTSSYKQDHLFRLKITSVDPSMILGFLLKSRKDYNDFLKRTKQFLKRWKGKEIFSIMKSSKCFDLH
ncbi:cysteine protease [Anaeramoeba flamelloides]|uniref:Cysteine protease n=1 Tax=Anaeramoeba flamelloides TaxID=1746091 RepID=A0ABQ8Z4K7_9EUKA|nr:cysteine protease [Anaeramoeba flamelloides]